MVLDCDVAVVAPTSFHEAVPVMSPDGDTVIQDGFVTAVYVNPSSDVAATCALTDADFALVPKFVP